MKRKIFLPLFFTLVLFSGFLITAQSQLPGVSVRFFNPQFDCLTKTYCVDVELKADNEGQQLFGINVRFFYDDNILEYLYMGDFAEGYDSLSSVKQTYPSGGTSFGLTGPLEWFNGKVVLTGTPAIYISTTEWTKYFNVCFHVDDPNSLNKENFCPSIIWDLKEPFPPNDGYLNGDDGVVISLYIFDSPELPTQESVVQFNWQYDGIPGLPFGNPVPEDCTSTMCGETIPLSDWALFLAIGLMLATSIFIYRRRI